MLFICLQCANSSFLEFNVASLGLNAIRYFSRIHNWHLAVTGLKVGIFFSIIFQVIFGFLPSSVSFQKYVERVVEFSGFSVSILALCL